MPDETFAFDVFLSHNSKDKPEVREIAGKLEGRGLRVWPAPAAPEPSPEGGRN